MWSDRWRPEGRIVASLDFWGFAITSIAETRKMATMQIIARRRSGRMSASIRDWTVQYRRGNKEAVGIGWQYSNLTRDWCCCIKESEGELCELKGENELDRPTSTRVARR